MLEVQNLTKRYGNVLAVNDLSFSIEGNGVYGFLGPNGAGKSTTMNVITGCLSATAGKVSICGQNILDNPMEAKACIGYLPEFPPLYLDMSPAEYLKFVAEAKGVARKDLKTEVARVIEATGLGEMQNRLIKKLSKGYKQRVGIAQAILGTPKIIILDEPTVGLDPLQIIEIRKLIMELGKEHVVILSSHILSEVAAVADKILIIARGELKAFDTPANLEKDYNAASLEDLFIELAQDPSVAETEKAWAEAQSEESSEQETCEYSDLGLCECGEIEPCECCEAEACESGEIEPCECCEAEACESGEAGICQEAAAEKEENNESNI